MSDDKQLTFYWHSTNTRSILSFVMDNPACTCPYCNLSIPLKYISIGNGICTKSAGIFLYQIHFIAHCNHCFEVFTAICSAEQDINNSSSNPHVKNTKVIATFPKAKNTKQFDKSILALSPTFVNVYQQAMIAHCDGLDKLVGMGLRKATEHLVTDYIIHFLQQEPKHLFAQKIDQMKLIDAEVSADIIRIIGNNETHTKSVLDSETYNIELMIDCIDRLLLLLQVEITKPKYKELFNSLISK